MKAVLNALYSEPVVFLAVVQAVVIAAATADLFPVWVPALSLAIVTPLQRHFATPARRRPE